MWVSDPINSKNSDESDLLLVAAGGDSGISWTAAGQQADGRRLA